jgi:gliding motility-associated-like protein
VNASGSYSVTVKDANGCQGTAASPTTVTVNPNPATNGIDGPSNFCPGGQSGLVYIAKSGAANSTYNWVLPAGATITSGANTNSITVSFGLTGGTISVTETTAGGCAQTTPVSINVSPGSKFASISYNPDTTVCAGTSVTLIANPANATSYKWLQNGTPTGDVSGQVTVTPIVGTYKFAVEVIQGTCKDTAQRIVTVNPNPGKPDLSGNSANVCESTKGVPFGLSSTTVGSSYTWTTKANPSSSVAIASGQGTGNITVDVGTGFTPNTIKLVVVEKNTSNCSTPSDTFQITVNSRPISSGITGSGTTCDQTTGLDYSVTKNAGVDYAWTVSPEFTITSTPTNKESITVDVKALSTSSVNGWVKVNQTVTLTGCTSLKPDSLPIVINRRPINDPISGSNSVCEGTTGQVYSITPSSSSLSVLWSASTGGTIKSDPTANSITVDFGTGPGPVKIIAVETDNNTGCQVLTPSEFDVNLNNNPAGVTIAGADSICGGGKPGKYYVVGKPTSTFTWTFPNGCTQVTSASSDTLNLTFDSKVISGDITVIETNATGCSSNTPSTYPIVNYPYAPTTVDAGPLKEICTGGVSLIPTGYTLKGFTAHWEVIRGTATFYNADHDTTTAWGFSPDTNVVRIKIAGKCDFTSDTLTVVVSSKNFHVTASSAADTVCLGGSAQIMVNIAGSNANPFTYNWLSSDNSVNSVTTDNQINVNLSSSGWVYYYVLVTDKNHCMTPKTLIDSVYGVAPQTLKIPNMITPNGDNLNDCWKIKDDKGVEIIPGSLLEIYNRWGDRVYKNQHYQNGDFCGAILPDGVYYYYLKPTCGIRSEEKGWINIISNTEESSNR